MQQNQTPNFANRSPLKLEKKFFNYNLYHRLNLQRTFSKRETPSDEQKNKCYHHRQTYFCSPTSKKNQQRPSQPFSDNHEDLLPDQSRIESTCEMIRGRSMSSQVQHRRNIINTRKLSRKLSANSLDQGQSVGLPSTPKQSVKNENSGEDKGDQIEGFISIAKSKQIHVSPIVRKKTCIKRNSLRAAQCNILDFTKLNHDRAYPFTDRDRPMTKNHIYFPRRLNMKVLSIESPSKFEEGIRPWSGRKKNEETDCEGNFLPK